MPWQFPASKTHIPRSSPEMSRGKGILASLRFIQAHLLPWTSPSRLPYYYSHYQASQYHHLLLSSSPLLLLSSSSLSNSYLNTQHKLYFSSEPNTIIDLIATTEWSECLEKELLEKFHSTPFTHETVVYILKKLDKTPNKAFDFFNWVSGKHGVKPNFIVYNIMVVVLSTNETIKGFWALTRKMSEEGCYVDKRAYFTVLQKFNKFKMVDEAKSWTEYYAKMNQESAKDSTAKGVVDVVLGSDWNDAGIHKLEEFKGSLSENTIIWIFHALHGDPLKALLLFRWLRENTGYIHNAVTYNAILRIIWKKESIEEFWKIVKEMESVGHDIDFDTYVLLSRHFRRNRMLKEWIELYGSMINGPYKARVQDGSAIINEIASIGITDMDLVTRVVKIYEAAGYTISKPMYDGIYRCFATAGKLDEAEKVLDTMTRAGFQPDNRTCYHRLFALGKAGKLEEAIEMLDNMEAKGYTNHLSAWTNLIRGHCTAGDTEKALKCYTIFVKRRLEVNADLLDILVKGLCEQRRVDSAYSLFMELVSKTGLKPFHDTYANLIQNLLGDMKLKEGINLLHLMKKHNILPPRDPFVDYISKSGTMENAMELLEALNMRKYAIVSAHRHVLLSFLKEGRGSEARDLLEKFPHDIRSHADILGVFASLKPENATM